MKLNFDVNVSRSEALRRYVIGNGLIIAVLASPAIPSWIALFACYPIFTAMFQWDPLNALFQSIDAKLDKSTEDALFRDKSTAL